MLPPLDAGFGRGRFFGPPGFRGPGPRGGLPGPRMAGGSGPFPPGPVVGPWAWSRVPGLLQASLLLALHGGVAHGYSLLVWVQEHGFAPEGLNAGTLYRVLRRMEELGLVESEWASEGSGPFRRDYRLTEAGERALQEWAARLGELDGTIRKFMDIYGGTKDEH